MIIPLNFLKGNSVKQSFQFKINTANISSGSSTNIQYRLPLVSTGVYNMLVDWGDGTTSTITTWNDVATTHTYPAVGIYEIEITGVCDGWRQNNTGDRSKIILVSRWGCLKITTDAAFSGCNNMYTTAPDALTITSISTVNMFRFCIYATLPNANDWDVSNVINMSSMFLSAYRFNAPIDKWDVSNVTNMTSMFAGFSFSTRTQFNQNIGSWNVSNVTTMTTMFQYSDFNNGNSPDINNWNTIKVTNMSQMFKDCPFFNQPIGNWNVSNVTNLNGMFYNTLIYYPTPALPSKFNQSLNNWNISKVTNLSTMFYGCVEFNQPLNNWNTSLVTNMSNMFYACIKFNQPLNNWNTSNVTNMQAMFLGAESFNQPLDNWNVSKVTTMRQMFNGARLFNSSLANWNIGSVMSNMEEMFYANEFFDQDLSSWTFAAKAANTGISCRSMFYGCASFNNGGQPLTWNIRISDAYFMFGDAVSFNQNIGNFQFSTNITNLSFMFDNAIAFNNGGSPDINNWQLTGTTPIATVRMFSSASAFNQPINNLFSITPIYSPGAMFEGATSFNQNIGSWKFAMDSSGYFGIERMFSFAEAFNNGGSPDINNWDFSAITGTSASGGNGFENMFYNAISFNQPIGNWNVDFAESMSRMFGNATSFNQDLSSWISNSCSNTEWMFNGATSFNNGGQPMPLGDMFPSLTNTVGMFEYATSFNQDISGINNVFSNLEQAYSMFRDATAFNNGGQPFPTLYMPYVNNVNGMFYGATSFDQNVGAMTLGGYNGPVNCAAMFRDAASFNNGGSTDINDSVLIDPRYIDYMFYGATAFNQSLENWVMDNSIYQLPMSAINFMGDKTPSTYPSTTYDTLLNGWYSAASLLSLSMPTDVMISFGTAKYTAAGQPGRDGLINDYGWVITDGGLA